MRALTIDEICFVSGGDGEPLQGSYYTDDNKYEYVTGESNADGSVVTVTAHSNDFCRSNGDYVAENGSIWNSFDSWQSATQKDNAGHVWDGFTDGLVGIFKMFAGAFGGWGLSSTRGDAFGCDY